MRLPPGHQVHAGELAIDSKLQARHVNLGEMHIDLVLATCASDLLAVDHREAQFSGEHAIDTTKRCTGVDKGLDTGHARSRHTRAQHGPEVLVESDVDEDGRAVPC